ncbi:MAG: response regulator, partial [Gammaproteobacteria bacterium]|nr:response regulator [Gammaproteobacteria bacterium]
MLRQNILIVDDHPENLVALEAILENENRNLVKANSGQEALTLAVKMDFALVLLDVQMPDMDGFEVASLMRKHKKTRSIPIIFVTAINKDQQYVFKGYEAGAVDYLFKPLDPLILEHKVQFFLGLDNKNRQLERRIEEVTRLKEDNDLLLKSIGEALIGVNTDGGITFANPAATDAFNIDLEDLLGRNISSLLAYDEKGDLPFFWPQS